MKRTDYQGVASIVRFNWPFYAFSAVVAVGALAGMGFVSEGWPFVFLTLVLLGSGYFLTVSLLASHWVYDRSDLYRFRWLDRITETRLARKTVLCHSGFDEVSELLRDEMGNAKWTVLDHYDPARMSEPSIRRARKALPPLEGTVAVPFDDWGLADDDADMVFGILAIHEFRSVDERKTWFDEARRVLAPGGSIVVVEHVRDLANFVAYGPGFLHFHSVRSWRESWEGAGLRLVRAFRITPLVRVFVISEK